MFRAVAARVRTALNAFGSFAGFTDASGAVLPVPYTLSRTAVMVGVPSSGSIANNGALTLTTVLPQVYSTGCYLFFPANAIAAGSTAGYYWTVMISTTVGQIFNNGYIGIADPAPPAVLTPFVTTGPGAYTQSTAVAISLRSILVPGNTLGASGQFRLSLMVAVPNTANGKVAMASFGAMLFYNSNFTSNAYAYIQRLIANRTTSAQITQSATVLGPIVASSAQVSGTVDTTANQTISITINLSTATDYFLLDSSLLEIFPS